MFQPQEFIIYRNHGVYQISDIKPISIPSNTPARQCYVLHPVVGTETIYVPTTHHESFRPVMSKAEADTLIQSIPTASIEPLPPHNNFTAQKSLYEDCLYSGDHKKLLQLIHTIHQKKESAASGQGKKQPSQMELQYFKQAESMLHTELSIALEIPVEHVAPYIEKLLH